MRFEESVKESHILKAEGERNLFHLKIRNLELCFGIREDGIRNHLSGRFTTIRFNGGADMR